MKSMLFNQNKIYGTLFKTYRIYTAVGTAANGTLSCGGT